MHIGDAVRSYTDEEGGHIIHRGILNTESVISWIQSQQKHGHLALGSALRDVVVMGSDVGSIAAQLWGNEILRRLQFPDRAAVVSDSVIVFPPTIENQLLVDIGACNLPSLKATVRSQCYHANITLDTLISNAIGEYPRVLYLMIYSIYNTYPLNYYMRRIPDNHTALTTSTTTHTPSPLT